MEFDHIFGRWPAPWDGLPRVSKHARQRTPSPHAAAQRKARRQMQKASRKKNRSLST